MSGVTDEMVRLDDCPEGLFLFGGKHLGFMTEYSTKRDDESYQRDAYVVESGEYFWGGTDNARDRAELLVRPLSTVALTAALAHGQEGAAEPVGFITKADFEELLAGNIAGYLFPAGTLRPDNEVPLYASPSADPAEVERLRKERDEALEELRRVRLHASAWEDSARINNANREAAEAELARMRQEREWQPIETAPKDGTRILIKTVTFGWNTDICQNVATGDKWVEARWAKDLSGTEQWLEWCGNEGVHTSDRLTPLAWAPLPSSEEGR